MPKSREALTWPRLSGGSLISDQSANKTIYDSNRGTDSGTSFAVRVNADGMRVYARRIWRGFRNRGLERQGALDDYPRRELGRRARPPPAGDLNVVRIAGGDVKPPRRQG